MSSNIEQVAEMNTALAGMDGPERFELLRLTVADTVALQRGSHYADRLQLEREWLEFGHLKYRDARANATQPKAFLTGANRANRGRRGHDRNNISSPSVGSVSSCKIFGMSGIKHRDAALTGSPESRDCPTAAGPGGYSRASGNLYGQIRKKGRVGLGGPHPELEIYPTIEPVYPSKSD